MNRQDAELKRMLKEQVLVESMDADGKPLAGIITDEDEIRDPQVVFLRCDLCGGDYAIITDRDRFESWQYGVKAVQDALPGIRAEDREILLSRTCRSCWRRYYGSWGGEDGTGVSAGSPLRMSRRR